MCLFSPVSSFNDKKIKVLKCYNKRITTRGNGNVQSHDQEECKLNSTIIANSRAHTLNKVLNPIQLCVDDNLVFQIFVFF